MSDPIKVAICVFTYKDPCKHLLASLRRPLGPEVLEVGYAQYGTADPVTERNLALWSMHDKTAADVIVFVDHDQSFPAGTIELLAQAAAETKGVVGCLIAKKGVGAGLAALPYPDDDQDFDPGAPTLLRLKAVGTGMLAIHRSVVDRLSKGREPVWYGGNELPPLFDNVYHRDGGVVKRLGEDFSFCWRCREADIPIHGAQQPEIIHWGDKGYTWRDSKLGAKERSSVDPIIADEIREAMNTTALRKFNVVTIRPDGYLHSDSFKEMSTLLAASLRDLGHDAVETENAFSDERMNIVLGANLLAAPDQTNLPPAPFVVYQLEQLADREGWMTGDRGARLLDVLGKAEEVWDYAPENIAWLADRGIYAKHLPIGYHEALETIEHAEEKDIDVLFYGSANERRKALIADLRDRGLRVVARWADCYGEERDALIARAKVVLCCHFYEAQVMEQLRISHLLNNHALVVAEASKVNPYGNAISTVGYAGLAGECYRWAEAMTPHERHMQAGRGSSWLSAHPMTDHIAAVLS